MMRTANKNEIIEVLEKMKEKLATPDTWVKGEFAVDKDGYKVTSSSHKACKWCLSGAINVAAGLESMLALDTRIAVADVISNLGPRYSSLSYFNDHKDTQHSDVIDVINKAIEVMKCNQ